MDGLQQQEHESYGGDMPEDGGEMDTDMKMARADFDNEDPDSKKDLEEMKKRLKEIEDEAGDLREMQAKVEKEMGAVQDLTVGQFVYVVRKRIKVNSEKAIFIFVKNVLPPTAAIMSAVYEDNKDEDGFLYMTYSGENTFGNRLQGPLGCNMHCK